MTSVTYGVNNRLYAKKESAREILTVVDHPELLHGRNAAQLDRQYQSSATDGLKPPSISPGRASRCTSRRRRLTDATFRTEYDTQVHALRTLAANGGARRSAGLIDERRLERRTASFPSCDGSPIDAPSHYLNASTVDPQAGQRLRRHLRLQLRPEDARTSCNQRYHRALQLAVLRHRASSTRSSTSATRAVDDRRAPGPPVQPVVHARGHRHVLGFVRRVRRTAGTMKGLILSGGKGTRLRPLTYTSAKQLVPVANKPVLFYGIEALAAAGITEIGIVVGDTQAEIRAAVGDGSRWGVRVTYIEQDAPRGLAHAVLISEPFIGRRPVRDVPRRQPAEQGDHRVRRGVRARGAGGADPADAACPTRRCSASPSWWTAASSGWSRSRRSRRAIWRWSASTCSRRRCSTSVKRIKPSFRNELEITDAIQDLIDRGLEVRPHIVEGWWKDTGKLEDMLEANRLILDTIERRIDGTGRRRVADRRQGRHRGRRGDRALGHPRPGDHRRATPASSTPTSGRSRRSARRARSATPRSSTASCSKAACISDLANRVEDSLIGRNVRIYRLPVKPSAYRFMLGDNSEVGIRW